jgi:hypothetical protein
MYRQPGFVLAIYTSIFAGLTFLTHPEMSLFVAYTLGLTFIYFSRKRVGLIFSVMTAAGALMITLPWLLVVGRSHGLGPLLAALQSGNRVWLTAGQILMVDFSFEPFLSIIGVTALLGALVCLIAGKRWTFLPVWSLLIALASPRSSATLIAIPLAMLAAIGLERVVLPGIRRVAGEEDPSRPGEPATNWAEELLQPAAARTAIAFFILYTLLGARLYPIVETTALTSLPAGERDAMHWVEERTPGDSRFLVVSAIINTWQDQSAEWFPTLANRVSVGTVQGYEWVPGKFYERWRANAVLQGCALQGAACLEVWAQDNEETFNYVYLSKRIVADSPLSIEPLLASLRLSQDYSLAYESPEAVIFARGDVPHAGTQGIP